MTLKEFLHDDILRLYVWNLMSPNGTTSEMFSEKNNVLIWRVDSNYGGHVQLTARVDGETVKSLAVEVETHEGLGAKDEFILVSSQDAIKNEALFNVNQHFLEFN